ncbi:unnamed protein product [Acanthoscelides obtectus]|uniref:non-specific serine/threonine protein kinase n=1 Tax=Acanthoscelides obtectus TaxID=200917 RepID=A0A9P0NWN5_ACAOB|nr:unnamed protein product [Acanthoscelides obtectus]CAK1653089.1 Serine/threonine-protein kinase grp [Acanthoscelides obtectus]
MQATAFVEDWLCYNTILGEGAYGEVRLLIHRTTQEKIACKIINHAKYKNASSNINREVIIHKMLDHENIIKYYGRRHEPLKEYIFLEYAAGGELFQLIEPDVGMPSCDAQKYTRQLLCGLKYLHDLGITHRDIKPENLLISQDDQLKISDFGMATMFRFKGRERLMDKKCGTKPYLAPEVLIEPYKAQPADLWSCGIVLVAMLTGELPWSEPTESNEEFIKWKKHVYLCETPWSKLGNTALSLVKQMLNIDPKKRLTLDQVLKHPWMRLVFEYDDGADSEATITDSERENQPPCKKQRWNSMGMAEQETRYANRENPPQVALSQPTPTVVDGQNNGGAVKHREGQASIMHTLAEVRKRFSFSQPTHNEDLMLALTQSPVTKDNFHHLVRRMTRFYAKCSAQEALKHLARALDHLHLTWNTDASGVINVSTVDAYKNQLTFKANLLEMDGKILLDFRLSKGCGLEFKKRFLKIKHCLEDII